MIPQEALDALGLLHARLSVTFVRYIVATESAEVEDSLDRKVIALYDEWCEREDDLLDGIHDLLRAQGVFAGQGAWRVEFSQFNYLGAAYLLKQVVVFTERLVADLEKIGPRLQTWPEAARLLEAVLDTEQGFLDRANVMRGERPPEAPGPAAGKGTSAARW